MQKQERAKRHQTAKHKDDTRTMTDSVKQSGEEQYRDLTFEIYSRIVEKAKVKIVEKKMYSNLVREEISSYHNSRRRLTKLSCR